MPETRPLLERVMERVELRPFTLEGFHDRRDRKRRNQRIAAGVVGIAVFLAAVWIVTSAGWVDWTETPAHRGGTETGSVETGPTENPSAVGVHGAPVTDYVLDLNTGKKTPLPESIVGQQDVTGDYAVSPDGLRLAYTGPVDNAGHEIFIANIDGTAVGQVTNDGGKEPAWSPDGSRIAYIASPGHASEDVFVLDLATGESTQVTHEPPGGRTFAPSFSRDGSSILFSHSAWRKGLSHGDRGDEEELRIVPSTGGKSVRLVDVGVGGVRAYGALSPDGYLLSYTCGTGDFWELCLANADGSNTRVLVPSAADSPEWSPDGTRIAYWIFRSGVNVVDVATGEVTSVTEGAYPTWLDDHTLIVEAN